jgi:hypothetical protein
MIEFAALGLSLLALVLALYGILGTVVASESEARVEALQGQLESAQADDGVAHGRHRHGSASAKPQKGPCRRSRQPAGADVAGSERRLYSRAAKMVGSGADLDEVMSSASCQAEAELLPLRKGRS